MSHNTTKRGLRQRRYRERGDKARVEGEDGEGKMQGRNEVWRVNENNHKIKESPRDV